MISHARELLSLALAPDMEERTHRAFLIAACSTDPKLISNMLQHSLISQIAEILLRNGTAPSYVIGRLAAITANCFLTDPKTAIQEITYLKQLLSFAYDTSVYGCFRQLLSSHPNMDCFYDWLMSIDFVGAFIAVMDGIDYMRKVEEVYYDEQFQLISSIYKLIGIGCENMNTVAMFSTPRMIDALFKIHHNAPDYVQGSHWHAIASVCGPKTAKSMEKFMPVCFSILYSPTEVLTSQQVSIIHFLTQMLDFDKNAPKEIIASQSLSVILRIVLQFHDSTILHIAFRKFVIHAMTNSNILEKVVELYVPILISECWGREHAVFAATAWFLMMKFKEHAKSNKKLRKALNTIPEYPPFEKTDLVTYIESLSSGYGGPLPLLAIGFA